MKFNMAGAPRPLRFIAALVAACCLMAACSSAQIGQKVAATPQSHAPQVTPSGPTSSSAPTPTPTGKGGIIDVTRRDPAVGDSLQFMHIDKLSKLDGYSEYWGLTHIYVPSKAGQSGFDGIAPLGNYCLVAITPTKKMWDGSKRVSLVIFSRYNETIEVYARGITLPDGVNGILGQWRETCWTGYYIPAPGDGNVLGGSPIVV